MHIDRSLVAEIVDKLSVKNSKIIAIYGSRQVGKTTLVGEILKELQCKVLYLNGDDLQDRKKIENSSQDTTKLASFVKGYDLLFIDEAQKIENIGINLKILYDRCQPLKIIVTGSSSFELANKIQESLAGRVHKYQLYPISFLELSRQNTGFELERNLEERILYGSYPDIFDNKSLDEKKIFLKNLLESHLYKDILDLSNIKYHKKIRDLVSLLAFQIGSEVSYSEIGERIGLSYHTVIDYVDLLEKSFIVKTLNGFSGNLRKEVNKKPKIYFYDLGIRNAIIGNFADLKSRNDVGALWENFLFIERMKRNHYKKHLCSSYFWRTYTGAELDYIESYDGKLFGYEFKFSKPKKMPKLWGDEYGGNYSCVTKDNFLDFIVE